MNSPQVWRPTNANKNAHNNISTKIRWGMLQGAVFITMFVLSFIGISCLMQQNQQK